MLTRGMDGLMDLQRIESQIPPNVAGSDVELFAHLSQRRYSVLQSLSEEIVGSFLNA